MQPGPVSGRLREAREKIHAALLLSGSADVARLDQALELLQAAETQIRVAETAIQRDPVSQAGAVRREAALLKRESDCMFRTIDACAALHRGLSLRLRGGASSYTSGGHAAAFGQPPGDAHSVSA